MVKKTDFNTKVTEIEDKISSITGLATNSELTAVENEIPDVNGWNEDKCKCEWKELIDKGICDKGFIWNPSNCECECDKSCDIGEYLDYKNCKCRKRIIDKLVEECSENIYEIKL